MQTSTNRTHVNPRIPHYFVTLFPLKFASVRPESVITVVTPFASHARVKNLISCLMQSHDPLACTRAQIEPDLKRIRHGVGTNSPLFQLGL